MAVVWAEIIAIPSPAMTACLMVSLLPISMPICGDIFAEAKKFWVNIRVPEPGSLVKKVSWARSFNDKSFRSIAGIPLEPNDTNDANINLKDVEQMNHNHEHVDTAKDQPFTFKITISFKRYIFGTAEGLREWCCRHGIVYVLISSVFRGVAQVVFMDNCWTGFIMFVGLMYFNYYYALLGLIGGCTNYGTAIILLGSKYLRLSTPNYLNNGIFVYNGLLIGLMCGTFVDDLNANINAWLLFLKLIPFCVTFSYICTSIHVGMTNMFPSFPVFTFPFNFAGFFYLPLSLQLTWMHSILKPYLAIDTADALSINNTYSMPEISYYASLLSVFLYTYCSRKHINKFK